MEKKESVLVIAGGEWQAPLVKKVRELGYETINSNLYENSPGFDWADHTVVANVLDRETNLEAAKKYGVSAVLTDESDIAVPTTAYVAASLGLPTIGEELAELFTNKYRMRQFCMENGLNTPEFALCKTADEAEAFVKKLGKKAIMKPLDSQSSRGVYIITKPEEIREHFEETVSFSRESHAVIVERFIAGTEFTVDGIVINGKHEVLAISKKRHYAYNKSIASELFFSENHPDYDYDKLRRQDNRFVDLAGLPFGLTHAEYKYEDGEFYLIEIAARGGGTRISSHIVPLMTGLDNYRILIESAMGHEILPEYLIRREVPAGRCAVLKFLDAAHPGEEVAAIHGEEEIRRDPNVVELRLEFGVGDVLNQAEDDRSRIGFYIAYAESHEELLSKMEWVENTLQIEYKEKV